MLSQYIMDCNVKVNSTGLSKSLNVGHLLGILARKLNVGKRQKENAITRAALSVDDGSFLQMVRTSVTNMQQYSKLTPDIYYKIAFESTLEYIEAAPTCSPKTKKEINIVHQHVYSPQTPLEHKMAHLRVETRLKPVFQTATKSRAVPETSGSITTDSADTSATPTKASSSKRIKRNRIRFSSEARHVRNAGKAPWRCPQENDDCSICNGLWLRRYRCSNKDCPYEHQDQSHSQLNSVEFRFVRTCHMEPKDKVENSPTPVASTSSAVGSSVQDPEPAIPPGPAKRLRPWIDEILEEEGELQEFPPCKKN